MNKEKIKDWIKQHRTELIIAGISTGILAGILLEFKNSGSLEKLQETLETLKSQKVKRNNMSQPLMLNTESVEKIIMVSTFSQEKAPHNVAEHLRNLPEGHMASEAKLITAAEHGYELLPGQTWVESYRTGEHIA